MRIFFLIVLGVLLVSCGNSPDTDFFERLTGIGEITIYREWCNSGGSDTTKQRSKSVFNCTGKEDSIEVEKRIFRVNHSTQIVVAKGPWLANRFNNCVVLNSKNWTCTYKMESEYDVWMSDGEFHDSFDFKHYEITNIMQIPYARYWFLSVRKFFGG